MRPLLLIDVDGVISLFGFDRADPPEGHWALIDGTPHFLSSTAASLLGGLGRWFELVWCSGWEERAAEHLPAMVAAPAGLAHLTFGPVGPAAGRHWKLDAIEAHAGHSRPLAWIDDGFDDSCRDWARRRAAPTELVSTDPAIGLTAAHADRLAAWAAQLRAGV
ncbi:MAG: hypothetical protein ACRDMX_12600 [Solirubrobacteraceae bacterium]